MKEPRRERSPLYRKILFGFTDHPITVWAGVILLRVYFEWIKLREELEETLVEFRKRSNNQIGSVEVMLSWFYGLALGAERFEHFTRYRRGGAFRGGVCGAAVLLTAEAWRLLLSSCCSA